MTTETIRIGNHGLIFTLRDGLTVESVKASPVEPSFWCRVRHRWETIGDPYLEPDDPLGAVLSLMWMRTTARLVRCKRCGQIATVER